MRQRMGLHTILKQGVQGGDLQHAVMAEHVEDGFRVLRQVVTAGINVCKLALQVI